MFGLPPQVVRVVAVDTEFIPGNGGHLVPICLVAHEFEAGSLVRVHRLWHDELGPAPPFPIDDQTLIVCHMAAAELEFFQACVWPMPRFIIDTHAEYRNLTNKALPKHLRQEETGLLAVLRRYGLQGLYPYTSAEKEALRELAMRPGPHTGQEKQALLDYCEADARALVPLLQEMLTKILPKQRAPGAPLRGLVQAAYRGRYMAPIAAMQHRGTQLDLPMLERITGRRQEVLEHLVEEGNREYGVYDGMTLRMGKLREYASRQGLLGAWPRTGKTGALRTDGDTLKELAGLYPELENFRQLEKTRQVLKDIKLLVGRDGRNRAPLWAYASHTGRNQPKASEFIFGQPAWMRYLVRPLEGMAMAYLDYSQQEPGIAAALSGDPLLRKAYESGDVYIGLGTMAGALPPDATKQKYPAQRELFKTTMLALTYGQSVQGLAARTGLPWPQAQALYRRVQLTYGRFYEWSQTVVDTAVLGEELDTRFGWRAQIVELTKLNTIKNWPVQAHGAEILRLAACLMFEAGIWLCAPVHDAFLIEAPTNGIDEMAELAAQLMMQASRDVLGGVEIRVDRKIIRYPDRFEDPHGAEMWQRVVDLVGEPG